MGIPTWHGDTLVYVPDGSVSVAATVPSRNSTTDRSGSIATGGTSQQVAAANVSRLSFSLENVSSGDLWVNFGVAAVEDQPSIKVSSGLSLEYGAPGFVPTDAVNVRGATTGQKFSSKES